MPSGYFWTFTKLSFVNEFNCHCPPLCSLLPSALYSCCPILPLLCTSSELRLICSNFSLSFSICWLYGSFFTTPELFFKVVLGVASLLLNLSIFCLSTLQALMRSIYSSVTSMPLYFYPAIATCPAAHYVACVPAPAPHTPLLIYLYAPNCPLVLPLAASSLCPFSATFFARCCCLS